MIDLIDGHPLRGVVADLAIVGGANMSRALADRNHRVMTRKTRADGLCMIYRRDQPTVGAMTVNAFAGAINMRKRFTLHRDRTRRGFAVMASKTLRGRFFVIEGDQLRLQPTKGAMTSFAHIGR